MAALVELIQMIGMVILGGYVLISLAAGVLAGLTWSFWLLDKF